VDGAERLSEFLLRQKRKRKFFRKEYYVRGEVSNQNYIYYSSGFHCNTVAGEV